MQVGQVYQTASSQTQADRILLLQLGETFLKILSESSTFGKYLKGTWCKHTFYLWGCCCQPFPPEKKQKKQWPMVKHLWFWRNACSFSKEFHVPFGWSYLSGDPEKPPTIILYKFEREVMMDFRAQTIWNCCSAIGRHFETLDVQVNLFMLPIWSAAMFITMDKYMILNISASVVFCIFWAEWSK